MNNIENILKSLLLNGDIAFANRLSRHFFNKSVLKVVGVPHGAKVWYLCCESKSKTEQLFVLRKMLFEFRQKYSWIPRLELAEYMKLRKYGYVYALPISASYVNNPKEFEQELLKCHNLLRLSKRRK
jgi:hypothetical protein